MVGSWGYGQKVIDKAESLNLVKQKRGPERDWATIVYRAISDKGDQFLRAYENLESEMDEFLVAQEQ